MTVHFLNSGVVDEDFTNFVKKNEKKFFLRLQMNLEE